MTASHHIKVESFGFSVGLYTNEHSSSGVCRVVVFNAYLYHGGNRKMT